MILQVLRIGLQRLRHNPVEVLLALVVPVVFFTIFALIFDKQLGAGKTKPIRVATVDIDGSPASAKLLDAVAADELVLHQPVAERHGVDDPPTAFDAAGEAVLRGDVAIAVVAPEGWAESLASADPISLQVIADTSDPIAPKMIESVVQRALGETLHSPSPTRGRVGGELGARRVGNEVSANLLSVEPGTGFAPTPALPQRGRENVGEREQTQAAVPAVQVIDLLSENKTNPVVSMYAAGIAVMFLLFSATGNAGQLLDEEENQTLERLMCSRLGMTQLLAGKWLLLVLLGIVQVTLMFAWAQLVFGVDLVGHLPGFALMTLATVSAAASLALVLAAACRSRGQLSAVSVILILTMSALGGSMVPRYLMSDAMQQAGRLTFNAWAIDGYNKIFWRDLPVADLGPELMVLGGSALALLVVARMLATRWEMA